MKITQIHENASVQTTRNLNWPDYGETTCGIPDIDQDAEPAAQSNC